MTLVMRKIALCKCENKGLMSIRAKIWACTWMSEKFGHSNAQTQKTGHSYTFFIKSVGGVYLAALKKGGGVFGRTSVLCHT